MIFSRGFCAVSCINFFVMTAYYMLFVISGPYAAQRFQASASTAGLVAGLMLIGCLLGRFFTGRFIQRFGFGKVLATGIGLYTASLLLYGAAAGLWTFMGVRFLSGLGVGCIGTVTATLVVHIVPPHLHGQGINYFSLSTILALALGPFFGLVLMNHLSFGQIFLICSGFGFVCFAIAALLRAPAVEGESAPVPSKSFALSDYLEYTVMPVALVVLLISVPYGCVQAFMAFFAAEAGLEGEASLFFLIYAAMGLCLRPIAGKLLDTRGENIVIYPAMLLSIAGYALLGFTASAAALCFAAVLLGAGVGNLQTAIQTVCVRLVDKRRFAAAISTYYIFLDLGIGVGPYLLGFIAPVAGYAGVYQASAVITALCLPLYWRAHGRRAGQAGRGLGRDGE